VGDLVRSIGIIGTSEGNGHPFSYGSIINGYSPQGLAESGWPGIYKYVRRRHASEFGIEGWKITHAWTQEAQTTNKLCAACCIPNEVEHYRDFLGNVEAVIIARDDYRAHRELSQMFLDAGLPVFIDKPLSVDVSDLKYFKAYLESGQLMSCSGMRYAREMDEPRAEWATYGQVKLIRGAIVLSWENYGIHMLDAIFGMTPARPLSVRLLTGDDASAAIIRLDDGALVQIDVLGNCARTFHVEIFGTDRTDAFDILDNFSMFRRMLWQFLETARTGHPGIPSENTMEMMRILIAGRISREENREVFLHEIAI
jgi:predicted dehydrogenase